MIIRKTFRAEVAHRLTSSYSKRCQSFHGHSYLFELILEHNKLNKDEMLIDFGEVKDMIDWFLDAFDHSMVLSKNDPTLPAMRAIMDEHEMRYMIVPYNPTAERMAQHIYAVAEENSMPISSVKVHETRTGYAEAFDGGGLHMDDVYFSQGAMDE